MFCGFVSFNYMQHETKLSQVANEPDVAQIWTQQMG